MKKIEGLDGIRGIAALGVVAYHVAAIGGFLGYNGIFDSTIGLGGCFVRLFFMLSSFSLMCGYFEKYQAGRFDLETFYKRRVMKLFPLFWIAMILHAILNILVGGSNRIWEVIGTATMSFGLMPSNQESMVWAGWTMGLQAIFYLIFPAFMVMVKNKKRAWVTFLITGLLVVSYEKFYGVGITNAHINIIRQSIYFAAGALIYHYKEDLEKLGKLPRRFIMLLCLTVELMNFYLIKHINGDIIMLTSFAALIILQIVGHDYCMNNRLMKWIGSLSFEIYLLHTIIYRILGFFRVSELISRITSRPMYAFTILYILVTLATILLSYVIQKILIKIEHITIKGVKG